LFIERTSNRDAMRVVHQMADALSKGQLLAVFPEGGTGDGKTLLPFHGNLLQAAIVAQAPIQPIGLQFLEAHSGEDKFCALLPRGRHFVGFGVAHFVCATFVGGGALRCE
jgi:1-acyl-sn-glycerol-3-phosphate acyltransferase